MIIIEDKAQKDGKHLKKHAWLIEHGHTILEHPLPVGDYILQNEKVLELLERKKKRGVRVKKMDFLGSFSKAVDTKFSIQELVGDICGKSHERFRDELVLAKNNGIKLYILVENEAEIIPYTKGKIKNVQVTSLETLFSWKNPRLFIHKNGRQAFPSATKGQTLAKTCLTMQQKYGCEFLFCHPEETGEKILSLLAE